MMKAQRRTLETIISPVRLGWHGALTVAIGVALEATGNEYLEFMGGMLKGAGALFYLDSLRSFIRTEYEITRFRKLDQRFVEPNLYWYCNRQGVRTAAANHGLGGEFDQVMGQYNEEMRLTSIPHW